MGNNDDLFNDDFDFDDDFDTLADDSSGAGFDSDEFDFGDEDLGDDAFDFDGDDLGGDAFADDFTFEDDFGEDDLGGLDDDLDFGGGDDFTGDDDFLVEDDEGGASPGFLRWVAILGGLFVLQLIAILLLFLLGGPSGPTDIELTTTAVYVINETTFAEGTARAGTAVAQQATVDAAGSVTPTPTPSPTNTRRPTFTPQPTGDPTETAIAQQQAAQAANETSTASAEQTAAAVTPTATEVDQGSIQETRDALATTFANITATFEARTPMDDADLGQGGGDEAADATPTPETDVVTPGGGGALTNTGELPDAGLFDDFTAGGSLGIIALAAFGLMGVIVFTRRLRSLNREDD